MSQLQIDWTRRDGHGLYTEVFPEAITSDEWGYPTIPRPKSAHSICATPSEPWQCAPRSHCALSRLRTFDAELRHGLLIQPLLDSAGGQHAVLSEVPT